MNARVKKTLIFGALAIAAAWPMIAWAMAPSHHAPPHGSGHGADSHAAPGGHGTEHGGEHAEGHGHWPPPSINFTDFGNKSQPPFVALLVNFGILAFAYYSLGKKPVAAALEARRTSVAKEIEEAQRLKKEADKRAEHYQEKLRRLEEDLATAKAALVEAGKGEKERIVREAEEKAARMQKDAEFLIEQEVRQMQQDLWREAVEKATAAAEDLLRKRVTDADQERLAEEYLADMAKRPAAKGGVA